MHCVCYRHFAHDISFATFRHQPTTDFPILIVSGRSRSLKNGLVFRAVFAMKALRKSSVSRKIFSKRRRKKKILALHLTLGCWSSLTCNWKRVIFKESCLLVIFQYKSFLCTLVLGPKETPRCCCRLILKLHYILGKKLFISHGYWVVVDKLRRAKSPIFLCLFTLGNSSHSDRQTRGKK